MAVITLHQRKGKVILPRTKPLAILPKTDYTRPDNINPNQRIVIMAAGLCKRWKNYLGIPKQFAPVNGEPIIKRTILYRLAPKRTPQDQATKCGNTYYLAT